MSLYALSEDELRGLVQRKVEALEMWLRRLAHMVFTEVYTDAYFDGTDERGHLIIGKKAREKAKERLGKEPARYTRPVDALLLAELIELVSSDRDWKHFKPALQAAFADTWNVTRAFLKRIDEVRNPLAHSNPISVRQAERALCYSNDVIDSIKAYYVKRGLERMYNAPSIVRVRDSLNHDVSQGELEAAKFRQIPLRERNGGALFPGETLWIEVQVDPAFEPNSYTVEWEYQHETLYLSNATRLVVELVDRDVADDYKVTITVVSDKNWHRHGRYDDRLTLHYRVCQPL